jgi:hypothetical protein
MHSRQLEERFSIVFATGEMKELLLGLLLFLTPGEQLKILPLSMDITNGKL